MILFIGYRQCRDICPTPMGSLRELVSELGADGEKLQVLLVTVDPGRDMP